MIQSEEVSDVLKRYRFGLEPWALLLFALIMLPNILWAFMPAPDDVLRVESLLRRAQIISEHRQKIGETILECDSLTVTRDGKSSILPQKEFMLLYKMASYPGKIFTRKQLLSEIWGYESSTDSHTVDVHIGRLRERFKDNPDFTIVTLRGVGYKVVRQ